MCTRSSHVSYTLKCKNSQGCHKDLAITWSAASMFAPLPKSRAAISACLSGIPPAPLTVENRGVRRFCDINKWQVCMTSVTDDTQHSKLISTLEEGIAFDTVHQHQD